MTSRKCDCPWKVLVSSRVSDGIVYIKKHSLVHNHPAEASESDNSVVIHLYQLTAEHVDQLMELKKLGVTPDKIATKAVELLQTLPEFAGKNIIV